MNGFAQALKLADQVVVTKIFPGREKDTGKIKAEDLVAKIGNKARFELDFDSLVSHVSQHCRSGDVVIAFGAGQSYLISQKILAKLKDR